MRMVSARSRRRSECGAVKRTPPVARSDPGSQTFQATIVKITPGGVQSTFATLSGNLFGEDVAFDSSGNLFVIAQDQNDPNQASTIYKFTPRGVQSTFGSMPGQGFGLAFDGAGNLFAADAAFQTIWKFTPDGTRSVFVIPSIDPAQGPVGLAFAFRRKVAGIHGCFSSQSFWKAGSERKQIPDRIEPKKGKIQLLLLVRSDLLRA